MDPRQAIAGQLLKLPDTRFYEFNTELKVALMDGLSHTSFQGIAIAAPQRVAVGSHDTLPVIMLQQQDGMRQWQVDVEQSSVLIAVDLRTGLMRSSPAFFNEKRRYAHAKPQVEEPEPPPEEEMAEAIISGAYELDARARLSLPWEAGVLALTVISFDWSSNTVSVQLLGGREARAPRRRPRLVPEATAGGDSLPRYTRSSQGPEPPPHGAILAVPADVAASAPRLPVHGAFRVKARDAYTQAAEALDLEQADAVVPVAVLLVGHDASGLQRAEFDIPARVGGDGTAEGHFSVDVYSKGRLALAPGTYAVYLVVDDSVSLAQMLTVK